VRGGRGPRVREGPRHTEGFARPEPHLPQKLHPPDATEVMLAAVDLGGTSFRCAVADGDGTFVGEASEPTRSHEGPEAVLGRIAAGISRLSRRAGERLT